jgi:pilus assembly protein CpaE
MSGVLRLAIVDPVDVSREALKSMLLGMDRVWLEADCSRYEFFPDVIRQTQPDIGVVGLDADPEKALDLIERLRSEVPNCAMLVVSRSTDGQLILRSIRAGAKEFLTLPLGVEDLLNALSRISDQKFGGQGGKTRSSRVTAVAGATGGVGSTSVAVNLGCVLADQSESSVCLVDLDLALGDADVFLDAIPEYTVADVTQNIARLDITLLKRSLTKHASGLYLLPRPVQLQDAHVINAENLQRVIGLLKASFSHVIIDLSKTYSSIDQTALNACDDVLLVTQLDLPCLRNVVRLLLSFEEFEGLKDKVKIVVNRVGLDSGQISLRKAKDTIGRDIFAQLPNDYRTMSEVRNNGVPLIEQAPKSVLTQAYRTLASLLINGDAAPAGEGEAADPAGSSGWRKFWPASKIAGKPKK